MKKETTENKVQAKDTSTKSKKSSYSKKKKGKKNYFTFSSNYFFKTTYILSDFKSKDPGLKTRLE